MREKNTVSTLQDTKHKVSARTEQTSLDLWEISEALADDDRPTLESLFEQGYSPEKAPGWVKIIVDLDKLNHKYELWKGGLLYS